MGAGGKEGKSDPGVSGDTSFIVAGQSAQGAGTDASQRSGRFGDRKVWELLPDPSFSFKTLAKSKERRWSIGALRQGGSLKSLFQRRGELTF